MRLRIEKILVAVVTIALGVLAFVHRGLPAAELDLNDGGIWVTNQNKLLIGHLNYQSQTLDGGLRAVSQGFDVSQSTSNVLVKAPELVQPVDVANVAFVGEASTGGLTVEHGSGQVLFADSSEGKVWSLDMATVAGFNKASQPTVEDLNTPRVTVGHDGVGYVLTSDGVVRTITGSGYEAVVSELGRQVDGPLGKEIQMTVVGSTLITLDGSKLTVNGKVLDDQVLAGGVLQQPSANAPYVLVATPSALLKVDLASLSVSTTEVPKGVPTRPVSLEGCSYGLWAKSGFYVRDCEGEESDQAAQFPELVKAKSPVFRTNRTVIVINDIVTGAVYLPLQSMLKVDNWDLITSQLDKKEKKEEDDPDKTEKAKTQHFSEEQHAPQAVNDELGARVGTATTLPILMNDIDIDGDALTAVLKDVPSDATVSLAKDGRAVRIDIPAERSGTVSFTYQAFDGSELSNVATVTVRIRSAEANDPPERQRPSMMQISERSNGSYALLSDWIDPDGDLIFLENATAEEGMSVTWRPDGNVSVRDLGTGEPGRRTVDVTVSDGRASATDAMVVQVSPGASNVPPMANNDHAVAMVGEPVTIRPLANDTDADADELKLVEIGPPTSDLEAKPDYQEGTIQLTATKAGSFSLIYAISDGPNTSKGRIRVDVVDPETASKQPAAENDLALLPPNGSVIVEPLSNDYDPAGGVLVVQNVSLGSSTGLNVEVVRHSSLRVSAPAGITKPQTFEYTVSNGRASATAKVLVIPLGAKSQVQSPVAQPESAAVRTGDVVTVDVLLNDHSPSDLAISLRKELQVRSKPELGEFFVSDDRVRFRAGQMTGTAEAIYTVEDSEGNVASALVSIMVRGSDDSNRHPVPRDVEARVFAGGTVRIGIPTDGVDPDGDSVELIGIGKRGPQHGSVRVEGNYLVYEAAKKAGGTDTFAYRVRDRFGAEGEGRIRVGVAPAPTSNRAPVAVPDEITTRPGAKLEIPATINDVDPDGDPISMVADSVKAVDSRWAPDAEIRGQKIVVTPPTEPGSYQMYYSITDGGGVPVVGVVTVTVDQNAAPNAPIARDDYVAASTVNGADSVEVKVLDNDADPDGAVADLKVAVEQPATVESGVVKVPLADERQVVLYTVTDRDGLSAKAAIVVPGRNQIPPLLNPSKVPAKVKGGQTLTIDFDSYVLTRVGRKATLTGTDTVVAGPGGKTDESDQGLKVVNERTISFTPDTLFLGATSVTFEVTDGDSLNDPQALRSMLSLPIQVESSGLVPPELRPSEIKVAPGEPPTEVSLAAMVNDPDPGDNERMTYSVTSASPKLQAKIDGQTIQVSADADVPVGTTGSIVVSVHDGSTDPQEMTLPVTVTTSSRPLMIVSEITEREGRVGKASTFDLSKAITNPFADQGGDIVLVGQPTVQGSASVSVSGLNLSVTPTGSTGPSDAAEDVVVSYRVADATRDPSRERTGVIRLTVKDTPMPPSNVSAEAKGSKTARVSWKHSGWRGGTPKGFVVSWPGGTKSCGLVTTCDIDSLANNATYTFTVRAQVTESDISESAESVASNSIFVDVLPNQPEAPRAKFGDQQIDLTWPSVSTPDGGSPVSRYTVSIVPADAQGRTTMSVTGTSHTWTNLKNGTAYQFQITAHNKLTETDSRVKAPQGPLSAPEVPAGAPSGQGAPQVVKDKATQNVAPRAKVSWQAPAQPNGDSSFRFELRQRGKDEVLCSGPDTSCYVTMSVNTEDKTFEVRSTNKSQKWSDWSPASNPVRAFQPPGAPSGFKLTPTGDGTKAKFTFGNAAGNGARENEIRYRWNAGGVSGWVRPGETINSSAFALGQTVSVRLTAVATVNGETSEGASATATVNAYAPPNAPSVSAEQTSDGNVRLSWNMGAESNGRRISHVVVSSTKGSRNGNQGLSGSAVEGTGPRETICVTVHAVNSEGQSSGQTQQCAHTRGPGRAIVGHGADIGPCNWPGTNERCDQIVITLTGWYPRSRVYCKIQARGSGGSGWYRGHFDVDESGNLSTRPFGNLKIGRNFEPGNQVLDTCDYNPV